MEDIPKTNGNKYHEIMRAQKRAMAMASPWVCAARKRAAHTYGDQLGALVSVWHAAFVT
jgi:hypothetical protein